LVFFPWEERKDEHVHEYDYEYVHDYEHKDDRD
jgi:hypothetical protein